MHDVASEPAMLSAGNAQEQVVLVQVQRLELDSALVRGQIQRLAPEVQEQLPGARGRVVRGR